MKPTVVRFYKGSNVTVRDIRIINSPLCHLKFDSSWGVKVNNITIASPQDSPNTDGIHLEHTRNVEIKHSVIGCGDDCVSMQTGCSNINIQNIDCSPSHGISIGSLGRGNSLACVSNVSIDSITVQNSQSAVRIKTWQGGVGSVRNVTFSNIHVSDVEVPIVIDQYYCNKRSCKNKTDAVAISGIAYRGIVGTYLYQPMRLACSDSLPCTDVSLDDIQLSPEHSSGDLRPASCWNTYGEAEGPIKPSSIGCLQRHTGKVIRALTKSHMYTC
ncbi:polygalacturonase [Iris pallida]|uniref:Polygalacturonase n=1 Tax=Iris pallida TaxID=29817 RepID=A0AAX6DRK6_IRIPA|nr:polygalacturonase [Iris pallida]